MTSVLDDIEIIDVDTHLPEPPDLWTSRLPASWGEMIPQVHRDHKTGDDYWFVNGKKMMPVSMFAYSGWNEFPPGHPPTWADAKTYTWDATDRLAIMDKYGIHAQVLYPNVSLFGASAIQTMGESEKLLGLVQAFNDYQSEWSSAAPGRLVPMTSLPFWDLNATIAEMHRCAELGHGGIVFTQEPAFFGLPPLVDRHWDRLWASAQEAELSVNFHVASGGDVDPVAFGGGADGVGNRASLMMLGVATRTNTLTLTKVIAGGICHRFPELNFVSVESDIGWIPYLLEYLDWQWTDFGVHLEHPEYQLLPSEFFKRQIYGMFVFEQAGARWAIERLGADNVMFETDFPHPGGMFPGPTTCALPAREFLEQFADLGHETLGKILHDNAARLYHLS